MRVIGDVRLAESGVSCAGPLAWPRPDRLLAVVQTPTATLVAVVDPRTRRVVRRKPLPNPVWGSGRARGELVLLLGAHGAFEPARVAVVDADGGVRVATLARVPIGSIVEEEAEHHLVTTRDPGLAVDTGGAFVLAAEDPVAEIDLATLDVRYYDVAEPASLLGRLRRSLVPSAQAKAMEGPIREARWLGAA